MDFITNQDLSNKKSIRIVKNEDGKIKHISLFFINKYGNNESIVLHKQEAVGLIRFIIDNVFEKIN